MGHIAGKEEILKQLQKRLHQNPVGLPEHATAYEILSILYTDKEAEVGAKFPFGAVAIEELEKATGIDKGDLGGILKGMMKKGLVVNSVKDNQVRYLLSPGLVGFFEFTFMRTNESLPMKRLAELMYSYRNTPEMVQELWLSETNRGKAFIYSGVLPQVRSEVLRFDEAAEHIRKAGRGSVGKCYCRHETWHLGKNCSA